MRDAGVLFRRGLLLHPGVAGDAAALRGGAVGGSGGNGVGGAGGAGVSSRGVADESVGGEGDGDVGVDVAPLLGAAARGDEDAWRRLIDLYARRVFALCKSRCHNADLAEEITQSVFATVAVKITGGEYDERNRFEPWLFRIAMNRLRDEMRRLRRHAEPTDPLIVGDLAQRGGVGGRGEGGDSGGLVGGGVSDGEILALREAVGRLSEADREIVELRHHAGLSFKQISELVEEPIGTLLARHHRALRKLREMLGGDGGGDGVDEGG